MTGISSHVFKRLVIVQEVRVGEFKRMAYYMTVYDWDLFSCVQEVSDCNLSIR